MPPASTSPWLTRIHDERRYPTLTSDRTADVAVVGGGIAGVTAAHFLTKAGRRVVLLEANYLGTSETGFTTAFLTSSVDTPFATLRARFGDDYIRRLRQAGEEAIALVERIVADEGVDCGFHRVDAYAAGMTEADRGRLEQEAEALRAADGEPEFLASGAVTEKTGVHAAAALRIPRQAAFDARAFLLGLAERIHQRGGQIFEESRMTGIDTGTPLAVKTTGGSVTAQHVVLATGLFPNPYKSRNALFRQMVTYVIAITLNDAAHGGRLPDALYWDASEPFHYMRFLNGSFFLGGEDRPLSEATRAGVVPWEALKSFGRSFIPDTNWTVTHQWRGQILETDDALPVVGTPPGNDPRVLLLSGFGGNGMTLGTRGGKVAADLIAGALAPRDNPFRLDRGTLESPRRYLT